MEDILRFSRGFSDSDIVHSYAKRLRRKSAILLAQIVLSFHNKEPSIRSKNVGPLQVIVFVGSPLTLYGLPPRGNTHHRERGRKPLSQARFNAKRGENQGILPTIDVESDPHFLPQICLLIHGATFFVRLLREPHYPPPSSLACPARSAVRLRWDTPW